ncbi:MAG: magnesium transporter CorA family protein [Acidimicrobiales bacterium]
MDAVWITPDGTKRCSVAELASLLPADDGFGWVDVPRPDTESLPILGELFGFHPVALDECTERIPVPKMHVYSDHAFVVVNGLERGRDGGVHLLPLKHFVGLRLLVTVHGPFHPSIDPEVGRRETRAVLERLELGRLHPENGVELAHAVVTGLVRRLHEFVGEHAGRITELERRVRAGEIKESETIIEQMFRVRHDLQTVRTTAAQSRQVYARLARLRTMPEEAVVHLRDIEEQFDLLRNICDDEKEYLQELLDLHQTRIANELNRFVRQLTAWGAIGLAGTLIAGIYGMNFVYMPEIDWRYGYPMALALMVVVGLVLAVLFRRKGWF